MSRVKSRSTFRVLSLLLVVALISTVMLSGTFAKYTSEYSGEDTALVAKWSFEAKAGTMAGSAIKDMDLFSHAYTKHINEKAGDDYIIAPGVSDKFTITMDFLSDVDAEVTVDFDLDGSTAYLGEGDTITELPIEYSLDGTTWVSRDGLAEAFVAEVVDKNASATVGTTDNTFNFSRSAVGADTATKISQEVQWQWAFERTDKDGEDTAFGKASADPAGRTSYILNVSVKAEQIQPDKL